MLLSLYTKNHRLISLEHTVRCFFQFVIEYNLFEIFTFTEGAVLYTTLKEPQAFFTSLYTEGPAIKADPEIFYVVIEVYSRPT